MSYDLVSVPRTDDESWDDALESAERDETTTPPNASASPRILTAGQQILGEVSVFEGDENYELTHEATGIQVTYFFH
jgi:hypothetical protein